jgi:hypothetical protein
VFLGSSKESFHPRASAERASNLYLFGRDDVAHLSLVGRDNDPRLCLRDVAPCGQQSVASPGLRGRADASELHGSRRNRCNSDEQ